MEQSTGQFTRGSRASGNGRFVPPPPGTRSADQIRDDIVTQRQQLSRSVDALRTRWSEATDLKRQVSEHRTQLLVGAAAVGVLIGAAFALRRRHG